MHPNSMCTAVWLCVPPDEHGLAARDGPDPEGGHMDWTMLGSGDPSIVDMPRDPKASLHRLNFTHMP